MIPWIGLVRTDEKRTVMALEILDEKLRKIIYYCLCYWIWKKPLTNWTKIEKHWINSVVLF